VQRYGRPPARRRTAQRARKLTRTETDELKARQAKTEVSTVKAGTEKLVGRRTALVGHNHDY
jgi:hypothetical protein